MQYMTIVLELLEQHPALHHELQTTGTLLKAVDRYATALRTCHFSVMKQLSEAKPESDQMQIASEALEIAVQELQDSFPPELTENSTTMGPLSLDAAMAFLNRYTLPA